MVADDDDPEVLPTRTVAVRETNLIFRLAPVVPDLSVSSQQVAIVAADTEDEAREIASKHDVFGRDWRNPDYAACEFMLTTEHHVFGDVVFRSEPVKIARRRPSKRARVGTP